MKRRTIAFIVITSLAAIIGGAWVFQLVYDWTRPNPWGIGWADAGKPWNTSEVGQPFEGARLVTMERHELVAKDTHEYTFPVQVLIVFPRESAAEIRGRGMSVGPRYAKPRWRYRFEDGIERVSSISIVIDDETQSVQIECRRFRLESGNLFCVFLNHELEFSKVAQLSKTLTTKRAAVEDFQRLLPNEPDIRAIHVY